MDSSRLCNVQLQKRLCLKNAYAPKRKPKESLSRSLLAADAAKSLSVVSEQTHTLLGHISFDEPPTSDYDDDDDDDDGNRGPGLVTSLYHGVSIIESLWLSVGLSFGAADRESGDD